MLRLNGVAKGGLEELAGSSIGRAAVVAFLLSRRIPLLNFQFPPTSELWRCSLHIFIRLQCTRSCCQCGQPSPSMPRPLYLGTAPPKYPIAPTPRPPTRIAGFDWLLVSKSIGDVGFARRPLMRQSLGEAAFSPRNSPSPRLIADDLQPMAVKLRQPARGRPSATSGTCVTTTQKPPTPKMADEPEAVFGCEPSLLVAHKLPSAAKTSSWHL